MGVIASVLVGFLAPFLQATHRAFFYLLERADEAYLKWEMKRAARDEPRQAVDPGGEVDPWILTSMWMQE